MNEREKNLHLSCGKGNGLAAQYLDAVYDCLRNLKDTRKNVDAIEGHSAGGQPCDDLDPADD